MFIFSNLATSLDGKIATRDRSLFPLGTPADRRQMHVLRGRADAILMGASTLRTHRRFCHAQGAKKQPINVILSRDLAGISPEWDFFREPAVSRLLLLTEPLSPARARRFSRSSELVVLPRGAARRSPAPAIIRLLEERGVKRLLVEGGGTVLWHFVKDNLLDEYHVTLTPRLLGGAEAPTLVDGAGFSPSEVVNLRLKSLKRLGDELFLVYAKTRKRGR
ncbi:MAG: dihydrofolate reductase family protein [Oligoflexia bacterium]|nr:dihydrofolate reductase family protein [Oligoflexia bacterium]